MIFCVGSVVTDAIIPPGVQWWETSAGSSGCNGEDLLSVGWAGESGSGCLTLPLAAAEDYWLLYYVWSGCAINVYAEEGCPSGSIVGNVPLPPVGLGTNGCLSVEQGFRALEVTCNAS